MAERSLCQLLVVVWFCVASSEAADFCEATQFVQRSAAGLKAAKQRVAQKRDENQKSTKQSCTLEEVDNLMSLWSLDFPGAAPFPSFSGSQCQQDAYEAISLNLTWGATADLRKVYPNISGGAGLQIILSGLHNALLMDALRPSSCSSDSDFATVVSNLQSETSKVLGVGAAFNAASSFLNGFQTQMVDAMSVAKDMLDMDNEYEEVKTNPTIGFLNMLGGSLAFMRGVGAFAETKVMFGAITVMMSASVGLTRKIITEEADSTDEYVPLPGVVTTNMVTERYASIVAMLKQVQSSFLEQLQGQLEVLAGNLGRLNAYTNVTVQCTENEVELMDRLANAYPAQLWYALAILMPSRYQICYQRNYNLDQAQRRRHSIPGHTCDTADIDSAEVLTYYTTSSQGYDACNSLSAICGDTGCTPSDAQLTQCADCGFTTPVEGSQGRVTCNVPASNIDFCMKASRKYWLAFKGEDCCDATKAAPSTLLETLAANMTGPINTYVNPQFNKDYAVTAQGAANAFGTQCEFLPGYYEWYKNQNIACNIFGIKLAVTAVYDNGFSTTQGAQDGACVGSNCKSLCVNSPWSPPNTYKGNQQLVWTYPDYGKDGLYNMGNGTTAWRVDPAFCSDCTDCKCCVGRNVGSGDGDPGDCYAGCVAAGHSNGTCAQPTSTDAGFCCACT